MKKVKGLKIVALIFPGLAVAILLMFTIGETVGGDWSGLGHLIQAIPIVLLMWLGWKRPLWGGIFLLVLAGIASYALRGPDWLGPFVIVIAPLFLSGILLLGASRLENKVA
jgi:hypothetical protein